MLRSPNPTQGSDLEVLAMLVIDRPPQCKIKIAFIIIQRVKIGNPLIILICASHSRTLRIQTPGNSKLRCLKIRNLSHLVKLPESQCPQFTPHQLSIAFTVQMLLQERRQLSQLCPCNVSPLKSLKTSMRSYLRNRKDLESSTKKLKKKLRINVTKLTLNNSKMNSSVLNIQKISVTIFAQVKTFFSLPQGIWLTRPISTKRCEAF